jgi:hypothetical protein
MECQALHDKERCITHAFNGVFAYALPAPSTAPDLRRSKKNDQLQSCWIIVPAELPVFTLVFIHNGAVIHRKYCFLKGTSVCDFSAGERGARLMHF